MQNKSTFTVFVTPVPHIFMTQIPKDLQIRVDPAYDHLSCIDLYIPKQLTDHGNSQGKSKEIQES